MRPTRPSRPGGCGRLLALVLAAMVLAGQAMAQARSAGTPPPTTAATPSGPSWASLSPAQRQALAPLERDWPGIDEARKAKWLELAPRFHKMPPDEQRRVQERMAEWARMSPAERGRARLNFQESKQFSPQEKQERWQAYQALPAEQRKALANPPKADAPAAKPAAPTSMPASGAAPAGRQVKTVAPTVVQAKPGATTTLINKTPPRADQRPSQPVIAARPGQVDSATLLPRSGPQAPGAPEKK